MQSDHLDRILPHPAATASELPTARGGKFDNPNANDDFKLLQVLPELIEFFLETASDT